MLLNRNPASPCAAVGIAALKPIGCAAAWRTLTEIPNYGQGMDNMMDSEDAAHKLPTP